MANVNFPLHYWDPKVHWEVLLAEFLVTDWVKKAPVKSPKPLDDAAEAADVVALMPERAEKMEEIKAQVSDMHTPFFRTLMFNERTHRKTAELVFFAIYGAASFPAVYWKDKFNRARPGQYEPTLRPPIEVPGHSAYPSGHSTQAHLVAHILGKLLPAQATAVMALADEIARNREVAGVHYASDSAAGKQLAKDIFAILNSKSCPRFRKALREARREW